MSKESNSEFYLRSLWQLFLVFLVLKLIGQIDWSWWYVTLPLTAPLVLTLVVLGVVFVRARRVANKVEKTKK